MKTCVLRMQAADFLFGVSAQPHDLLHEPLMRIFATGSLTAAAVSLALKVRSAAHHCHSNLNGLLGPCIWHSGPDALVALEVYAFTRHRYAHSRKTR